MCVFIIFPKVQILLNNNTKNNNMTLKHNIYITLIYILFQFSSETKIGVLTLYIYNL